MVFGKEESVSESRLVSQSSGLWISWQFCAGCHLQCHVRFCVFFLVCFFLCVCLCSISCFLQSHIRRCVFVLVCSMSTIYQPQCHLACVCLVFQHLPLKKPCQFVCECAFFQASALLCTEDAKFWPFWPILAKWWDCAPKLTNIRYKVSSTVGYANFFHKWLSCGLCTLISVYPHSAPHRKNRILFVVYADIRMCRKARICGYAVYILIRIHYAD